MRTHQINPQIQGEQEQPYEEIQNTFNSEIKEREQLIKLKLSRLRKVRRNLEKKRPIAIEIIFLYIEVFSFNIEKTGDEPENIVNYLTRLQVSIKDFCFKFDIDKETLNQIIFELNNQIRISTRKSNVISYPERLIQEYSADSSNGSISFEKQYITKFNEPLFRNLLNYLETVHLSSSIGEKIHWIGSPSVFGHLFLRLIELGYIKDPHGQKNKPARKQTAKNLWNAFDFENKEKTTLDSIYKELTIPGKSLSEKNAEKYRVLFPEIAR